MTRAASLIILILAICSCSTPEEYVQDADEEVSHILKNKQEAAFAESEEISIDWKPEPLQTFTSTAPALEALPVEGEGRAAAEEGDGGDGLTSWNGPLITLSLQDALYLAKHNSREYQSQRENVYLSALSLSLERHRWDFIPYGEIDGAYNLQNREYFNTAGSSFGFNKLLSTGGTIGASISTNFIRFLTGDPRQEFISSVSAAFSQPLLRGAGKLVAQEALTQSERDTVYTLRDFRRFQQTFTVSVASSFYGVLEQKDRLENQRKNYESLVFARESTEALAQAGRRPEFEVDQARQSELRSEDDLNRAIQSYNRTLDNFKITLGLRTDANIELDIRELDRLTGGEEGDIPLSREEAEVVALRNRYDFLTALDELEDAERKVLVAKNGFLPELNLVGGANFGSIGPNNVINVRPRDGTYDLGLELDLPFDRKEERNLYRQALITLERTKRQLQEDSDLIRLDIRDSFRALDQARESVDIQTRSVELAVRRKDSTEMLIEAGEATTRDFLDSQADLLGSQNSLTSARIDYNIAKLELLSNMGILEIDDSGMWKRPAAEDIRRMIESADNQGNEDHEK